MQTDVTSAIPQKEEGSLETNSWVSKGSKGWIMVKATLDPALLEANCSSPARADLGRNHSDLQSGSGNVHEDAGWAEKNLSLYCFTFSCYACFVLLRAYYCAQDTPFVSH